MAASGGRSGRGRSAFGYDLGKLRTEIARRLTWLPVVALVLGAGLAFAFAPAVDGKHPPDRLEDWFILVLTVLAAFGAVLLFFQLVGRKAGALRYLGGPTVAYFLLGICAAILGVLPWQDDVYRYLFAASVGLFAAALVNIGMVAVANFKAQKQGAADDARDKLAKMQDRARKKSGGA